MSIYRCLSCDHSFEEPKEIIGAQHGGQSEVIGIACPACGSEDITDSPPKPIRWVNVDLRCPVCDKKSMTSWPCELGEDAPGEMSFVCPACNLSR